MSNVDHIRIYLDEAGEWRWSAIAANNEIVAEGESHTRREDAIRAAVDVVGPPAPKIVEDPRFG